MGLSRQILSWAEDNLALLSTVHLKGTENTLADLLSRSEVREAEWSLKQELFKTIRVGAFPRWTSANQIIAKTSAFSLQRQDQALGVDALAHKWDFPLSYTSPPHLQLITRVLAKFKTESTDFILIFPYWPKRPWFSTL